MSVQFCLKKWKKGIICLHIPAIAVMPGRSWVGARRIKCDNYLDCSSGLREKGSVLKVWLASGDSLLLRIVYKSKRAN